MISILKHLFFLPALSLLLPHPALGQRFQRMVPNSVVYFEVGTGLNYTAVKTGVEIQPKTYLELQALTDGGKLWNKYDRRNDWRSLSLVTHHPLPVSGLSLITGAGIIQTTEGIKAMFTNENMGLAPQVGLLYARTRRSNWSVTAVFPVSRAPKITMGVLASYRFHLYFFRPERGILL